MKIGTITLNTKMTTQAFVGPAATEKARPGERIVALHLGTVDINSVQHFSADGALLALGYGPVALTRVQHGLVDVLQDLQIYFGDQQDLDDNEQKLYNRISAALLHAENFSKSAGPLIDPIIEDAMRFQFMLAAACNPVGSEATMANVVGDEMPTDDNLDGIQEKAKLVAILDEARRRLTQVKP